MISKDIAEFAHAFDLAQVPDAIVERSKYLILDAIGIAHASGTHDFAHKAMATLADFGSGDHRLIGSDQTATMRDAMLLNGILVHGLDFDDTHTAGVIHATASSFPCVLALGEKCGSSAREMLEAYVLAMEVSTRLGAVAKGGFHAAGFHPTGVIGIFGCSVAACRLLGLSVEQTQMAQGIALSMASGSLEFLEDGAWTKRMHPGWAAGAAVTAAIMAKNGYIGPRAAYEGRYGLYASYLGPQNENSEHALATRGLGTTWEIEGVAVKPLPACHFTHAAADAAAEIQRRDNPSIDAIEKVRVKVPAGVVNVVCEPVASKKKPKNSYEAQFSIPYAVATGLLTGDFQLKDLEPEALGDSRRLNLASLVEYEQDPEADFPRFYSGEVCVHLKDGSTLSHREHINRGNKERPLSNADVEAKYRKNMAGPVSAEKTEEILAFIQTLDRSDVSCRDFARALANAATASA
ncbi:MmgE/PrpD family protein [Salinisphaera aquimarina]|uniref:MmgE/PrpD family protein n=1 Tax=Salinisphaera aquimarina TaxID=2094031 RepID=A0ABV7ET21_9GAMM